MELKNIKTSQDYKSYCRNITRLLDSDIEVEFILLKELSEVKYQMERLNEMDTKYDLIRQAHDFLLSDGIVGRIVRFKLDSYIKLFKI